MVRTDEVFTIEELFTLAVDVKSHTKISLKFSTAHLQENECNLIHSGVKEATKGIVYHHDKDTGLQGLCSNCEYKTPGHSSNEAFQKYLYRGILKVNLKVR